MSNAYQEKYLPIVQRMVQKLNKFQTPEYSRVFLNDNPLHHRLDLPNYLEGIVTVLADTRMGTLPLLASVLKGTIEVDPTDEYYSVLLDAKNEEVFQLLSTADEQYLNAEQRNGFLAASSQEIPMIAAAFYRDPLQGSLLPELLVLKQLNSFHGLGVLKHRVSEALIGRRPNGKNFNQ